jgi:glycosyltransferase involved in cell wall biosynthesis
VDVLTANCEAVRRFVEARYGIERERIRVIYGGVDVRRFSPSPRSDRGPGTPPVIGCVGRLHSDKGQMLLVSAAPAILKDFPAAKFVLAGDGPQRSEIEAAISRLGISESVRLLGDRRDVPEILAGIDVAVLPSTSEGFANAALEGLACGVPMVVSDAGGNPEIVTDRLTGRVFPAGDVSALAACIVEMLQDPARRGEMAREGRRMVETVFPLEEMVRRHEDLYEDVLRAAQRGSEAMRVKAAR